MVFNSRKFYVGVVSLEIVLAAYLLYYYFGRTPDIEMQPEMQQVSLELDPNVGKIGDIGVGDVQTAKFTELNDQKQVVREFGFEKLIHKSDQQWEIENPYMDIFNPDYKCHIVADKGIIQIDSTFEVGSPEDATLIGNVVVTITAEKTSKIPDITIYLDDMTFISDRSLFLTPGPVKLISQDVQLTGRGLELIYNSEQNLVEYLKLANLEELKFKIAKKPETKKVLSESTGEAASKGIDEENEKTPYSAQKSITVAETAEQPASADGALSSSVLYHCTFNKNVFVDSAEQVVFARESFSINNVFINNTQPETKAEPSKTDSESEPEDKKGSDAALPAALSPAPAEIATAAPQFYEAVLTCDKGFIATPANSDIQYTPVIPESEKVIDPEQIKAKLKQYKGRTVFTSDKIDYDIITDNVASIGTSDMVFYPNAAQNDFSSILKVTSHDSATFLADTNKILLKGDCFCQLSQADQNDTNLYTLSSPLITIDLFEDKKSETMSQSLKKFTAQGPAEILVYSPNVSADNNEPLKLQANKSIIYQPDTNQMLFEGDCLCQMVRLQSGAKQVNTLKAERIAVQLVEKKVAETNQLVVEQISALGGNVRLISQAQASSKDQPLPKASVFVADRINYIADSNAIIAPGPAELTFYPQTESDGDANGNPVTITAKKQTAFLMDINKIIFEGDCLCNMSSKDPNDRRYYTLSSPQIAVSLADDPNSASGIENVTASGGIVTLISRPLADMAVDNKNGVTTFITNRIDYSLASEAIVSEGPSELTFYPDDNSKNKVAFPIRMTAQKSVSFLTAKNQVIFEGDCRCTMLASLTGQLKNYTLTSPKIIANLSSEQQVSTIENMIALGPLELVFYVEGADASAEPVPVKINAEKSASFLPESNNVVFEGNCICTMVRYDKEIQKKHILSSQRLIATLPKSDSKADSSGLEHITATGGIVQITVVEISDNMTLGFSKIKCSQVDYDDIEKTIFATGPGMVIVDNSRVKVSGGENASAGYSLSRPCYVFLRDFDNLQYYINANKIIAQGGDKRLLIDYFPAGKDAPDSQITSTAGLLQVNLVQTAAGQTQISTIHAESGITYEDSKNQIIANEMFYDSALSVVTARGSQEHSCMLNGVFVDEIQYDLKAGAILKTTLGKPSLTDLEK